MSKATLLVESREVDDPEQAFILQELIRFLKHPTSGVSSFTRMSKGWSSLCATVKQGAAVRKNDPAVSEAVNSWYQLVRYLALELTASLSQPVQIRLSRRHARDPGLRLVDDIEGVVRNSLLSSEFSIPNAASPLILAADLRRRTLNLTMKMKPPADRKRATASINWLLRQLRNVERDDLLIRVVWPRKLQDSTASIADVRVDPACLIHDGLTEMPVLFEVIRVVDLAGRFGGVKSFVEYSSKEIPSFYKDAGEHLRAWVPRPPKLKQVPNAVQENAAEIDVHEVKEASVESGAASKDIAKPVEIGKSPDSQETNSGPDRER